MHSKLNHQTRRRGIADAELEGRGRERRVAEHGAAGTHGQRIPRKQIPTNVAIYPQSSMLSGPVPGFTVTHPEPSGAEA